MKALVWLCLAIAVFPACGDDDDDDDATGDGDADADADTDADADADGDGDADGDADGDSLTFIVLDARTLEPLAGATITADLPGGARVEEVSAADGKATIDGIDWEAGSMNATAYMDGYALTSALDLTPATLAAAPFVPQVDGATAAYLTPLPEQPDTITVSGTATNLLDDSHAYAVNVVHAAAGSEWTGNSQSDFSVTAPRGEPFVLQALELDVAADLPSGQGYEMPVYRVMHQQVEATDEDLTDFVLDFAAPEVPTNTADISIALPSRPDSPVRLGHPVCLVLEDASIYSIGWSTYLDISEDGNQFDASMLWTEPAWAAGVTTTCRVFPDRGSEWLSFANSDGYPEAGPLDPLLDVPEWVVPADTWDAVPMHDPLEWETFDDVIDMQMLVVLDLEGQAAWRAIVPPGSRTAALPDLPASIDPVALFGTDTEELEAFVMVGAWDPALRRFARGARGDSVYLLP